MSKAMNTAVPARSTVIHNARGEERVSSYLGIDQLENKDDDNLFHDSLAATSMATDVETRLRQQE